MVNGKKMDGKMLIVDHGNGWSKVVHSDGDGVQKSRGIEGCHGLIGNNE